MSAGLKLFQIMSIACEGMLLISTVHDSDASVFMAVTHEHADALLGLDDIREVKV